MRYLLDTNILIEAVGGSVPAVVALERSAFSDWAGYSSITRLELFGYPQLQPEEERALTLVTAEFREVAVGSSIIDRAIRIRRTCHVRVPDAIIAATALETNSVLITRNQKDFEGVESLQITNPWIDL